MTKHQPAVEVFAGIDVSAREINVARMQDKEGNPTFAAVGNNASLRSGKGGRQHGIITAQFDFSCPFASAVRFMAFADRSRSFTQDVQDISRFSCMLFLSVHGFLDFAGPDNPLAI